MSAAKRCTATTDRGAPGGRPASAAQPEGQPARGPSRGGQPGRVAVVGGGIGGFAAALAFARLGASVVLHEQSAEIAEVGAGLQITPNGARALAALGCADALDSIGIVARAVVPTDAVSGRPVARFALDKQSPPYRFVHRAALIGLLHDACRADGVRVRTGRRIDGIDGGDFADADLVIGADGIRSRMRGHLNGPAEPFFTGQVAWRAVVQADHPPEARIWMAPRRHAVTYPLTGTRVNIVGVEERRDWACEGWRQADDPTNLRLAFARCAPGLRDLLDEVTDTHLWGLFRHEVPSVWQDGRVVLVGDAAHPTLPFLAQGANLALEDAVVLARCVADMGQGPGLAAYAAVRRPRVSRAIAAANANARNYHLSGLKRRGAHFALGMLGRVAPGAFIDRLDWLYGFDAGNTR